jgi:hypothetical protein
MSGGSRKPVRSTGPSLEVSTQLGDRDSGRWILALYRDAAEAVGSFRYTGRASTNRGRRGEAANPERSREVAARRSVGRIRRYGTANRLNRLGTLTYAESCFDQAQARCDIGDFFRSIRGSVGKAFPYVWVPEWHPGGHGLHVHFAVGRFIHRSQIEAAWGRGFVHIKLLGELPMGGGSLDEARAAARYLAKYVVKGIEASHDFGRHRFDVAQGFGPKVTRLAGRSMAELISAASDRMGGPPSVLWRSRDEREWFGPPSFWVAWNR